MIDLVAAPTLVKDAVTAPTTIYREVDMGFWLEQAEAAMRELALPGERSDGQIRQGRHD